MSDIDTVHDENSSTALMPKMNLDDAAKKAAFSSQWGNGLFSEVVNRKARAFLAAYSVLGIKTAAARAADCGINMHQYWLANVEGYPEAFAVAEEIAGDVIEREVLRRAVEGWWEPVYQRGILAGHVLKHDGRLLETLLAGAKPHKYARRSYQQISGPGGGPIQTQSHVIVQELSDDDLARIATSGAAGVLPGALPMLPEVAGGRPDGGDDE